MVWKASIGTNALLVKASLQWNGNVFLVWQPLVPMEWRWFSMVCNHWSNDGMVTIHRCGLISGASHPVHHLRCITPVASTLVHYLGCITSGASPLASSLLEQSTMPQLSTPRILAGFTLSYSHTLTLLHSHTLCCTLKTQWL